MSCTKASTTGSLYHFHLPHQALLCTWSFGKKLVLYLYNLLWEIIFAPSRLQLICTFQEHNRPLYPISVGIPQGSTTFLISLRNSYQLPLSLSNSTHILCGIAFVICNNTSTVKSLLLATYASLSFYPLSSVCWHFSGSFLWNQLSTPRSRLLQSSHLSLLLLVHQYKFHNSPIFNSN